MATLGTFVSGQTLTAAELNAIGTWTTFTPSWSNLTVGNATQSWRYTIINKIMIVAGSITLGSTSTVGNVPQFAVPDSKTVLEASWTIAQYEDSGAGFGIGISIASASSIYFFTTSVNGTYPARQDVTATVPFTWAANDKIQTTIVFGIS